MLITANLSFLISTANMMGGSGSWTGLFLESRVREWYDSKIVHKEALILREEDDLADGRPFQPAPYSTVRKKMTEMNSMLKQLLNMPERSVSILAVAQLFLYDNYNDLLQPQPQVCQDMNQPLAHYWISCSHNTCCWEDQYMTKCDPEVFEWVLLQGCRCIELDLWDDFNGRGEPIVCHGPTTGLSSMQATLEAIKKTAFLTSPYPVIISLDCNCSEVVQLKVATALEESLGALMILPGELPKPVEQHSPAELCGRFIIRGKKPNVPHGEQAGFLQTLRQQRKRAERLESSRHDSDEVAVNISVVDHNLDHNLDPNLTRKAKIDSERDANPSPAPSPDLDRMTPDERGLSEGDLDAVLNQRNKSARQTSTPSASARKTSTPSTTSTPSASLQDSASLQEETSSPTSPRRRRKASQNTDDWLDNDEGASSDEEAMYMNTGIEEQDDSVGPGLESPALRRGGLGPGLESPGIGEVKKKESALAIHFEKKVPPPQELQRLTTMIAIRLPDAPEKTKYNSYTIAEGKVSGLFEDKDSRVIREWHHVFNAYMIRTFPPATCVLSQNYDPQKLWAAGVHAIALNFQHVDTDMKLQRSWFERNGGAGYVLKPSCLREVQQSEGWTGCAALMQPNTYLAGLPSSKKGEPRSNTTAEQDSSETQTRSRKPCAVLKVAIKFVYSCRETAPDKAVYGAGGEAYYDIMQETADMGHLCYGRPSHEPAATVTVEKRDVAPNDGLGVKKTVGDKKRPATDELHSQVSQQRPVPDKAGKLRVMMETRGVEPDHKKVSTHECDSLQGFGAWDEAFEFPFLTKETALCSQLFVEIVHDTAGVIADRAFPLAQLRKGNGELRLSDPKALCTASSAACLVCDIEMGEQFMTQEEFIQCKRYQSMEDQISNENVGL